MPSLLTSSQAVYNIITGMFPCTEEEAVQLAALQFQAKFGKYNAARHVSPAAPLLPCRCYLAMATQPSSLCARVCVCWEWYIRGDPYAVGLVPGS